MREKAGHRLCRSLTWRSDNLLFMPRKPPLYLIRTFWFHTCSVDVENLIMYTFLRSSSCTLLIFLVKYANFFGSCTQRLCKSIHLATYFFERLFLLWVFGVKLRGKEGMTVVANIISQDRIKYSVWLIPMVLAGWVHHVTVTWNVIIRTLDQILIQTCTK
jgi:hypothetical protein